MLYVLIESYHYLKRISKSNNFEQFNLQKKILNVMLLFVDFLKTSQISESGYINVFHSNKQNICNNN